MFNSLKSLQICTNLYPTSCLFGVFFPVPESLHSFLLNSALNHHTVAAFYRKKIAPLYVLFIHFRMSFKLSKNTAADWNKDILGAAAVKIVRSNCFYLLVAKETRWFPLLCWTIFKCHERNVKVSNYLNWSTQAMIQISFLFLLKYLMYRKKMFI